MLRWLPWQNYPVGLTVAQNCDVCQVGQLLGPEASSHFTCLTRSLRASAVLSGSAESQNALHAFIHSPTQQLVTKHLLCAGRCPRCWRHRLNSPHFCPPGVHVVGPVTCVMGLPGLCSWGPWCPGDAQLQRPLSGTPPRGGASFQESVALLVLFILGRNAPSCHAGLAALL